MPSQEQRGLMARVFRQVLCGDDAEAADLAVKPSLAGQADRAAQLRVILIVLALAVDRTADIAAGECELVCALAQTIGPGPRRFGPGPGGNYAGMLV